MKKILLPLLVLLLLTGCSKIDKASNQYDKIVNDILIKKNYNVNTASVGYKYYIPIGVNLVYDSNFNKKFMVDNTEFVLYVDVVSYYYKNNLNYNINTDNVYYYSKINDGYIYIENAPSGYYVKIIHNYAKIESYVKEENLVDVIVYSTIILNSISYNDNLISNFIEEGISLGNEIDYEIEKPENSESKFSQYLQEYVQETTAEDTDEVSEEDNLFELD